MAIKLSADEIALAIQAVRKVASKDIIPAGYSIDSRTLRPGDCFIAIRGVNYDGHQFIADAVRKGACLIIAHSDCQYPVELSWPVLYVNDTLIALQKLANYVRRKWGKTVIGITGSIGKTTTKEITGFVLESLFKVFKSMGNFNNDYGLPLSILKIEESHDIAVLEMGMSHAGEIARLCQIAQPSIGIVTNVRPVHLENFSSVSSIAKAKRELIESLSSEGTGILNNDDRLVRKFGRSFPGQVVTFGIMTPSTYRAADVRFGGLKGNEFRLDHKSRAHLLHLPLIGEHNIYNCLPGIAIAHHLGLGFEIIAQRMEQLKPAPGRGEILHFKKNFSVLNDTYNSNPAALEAMLKFVKRLKGYRRKILVAGEMLELGPAAKQYHRDCGSLAAGARIDLIIGVRGLAEHFIAAAREHGYDASRAPFFEDPEAAGEWLTREVKSGDLILVKGSRGVKTEKVIEVLKRDHALAA